MVYWRRARWGIAAAIALVLASAGWFASTRVGPASVDWETVTPMRSAAIPITVPTGRQKWWLVTRGDSLIAVVDGGAPLRVEFRLVMPQQGTDSNRYVVAVAVDGQPQDWDTFTAVADTAAGLPGFLLGDRDRLQFELPPGRHEVRVMLIAGHSDSLLVRIRRPE